MKERLTTVSHKPEWGSIELVRAALQLIEEALQVPDMQRFVLASESCIPITTFSHAVDELWATEQSWMDAWGNPSSGNERYNQFGKVGDDVVPRSNAWKGKQKAIKNR